MIFLISQQDCAEKGEDSADVECTSPPARVDAHIVLKGRTCKKWILGLRS